MTPEEKAKLLIDSFIPYAEVDGRENSYAKQCAIIAVDEILNDYSIFNEKHKSFKVPSFWQQVKKAIEKL